MLYVFPAKLTCHCNFYYYINFIKLYCIPVSATFI